MIDKLLETIGQNRLIDYGDKIVVGLSGGADSLSLTHALLTHKNLLGIEVIVVHINHMLRGNDAVADANFVEAFCKQNEIEYRIFDINVSEIAALNGMSFEEAGRMVRYEKFFEVLRDTDAQKIAVAQNRNDVLETFFINLFRGSGVDGLASIEYLRDDVIIRPLLDIPRTEIELYCKINGLEPRHDYTNDENEYMRNKVRNVLLPNLREQFNPSIDEAIFKTVSIMRTEKEFWRYHNEKLFTECCKYEDERVSIGTTVFDQLHYAEKAQLIRHAIKRMKGNLTNLSFEQLEQIIGLTRTGARVKIDHRLFIRRSHNDLILYWEDSLTAPSTKTLFVKRVPLDALNEYVLSSECVAVDADAIVGNVHARTRKSGDEFVPLGMKGHKKIKAFFIDEKIPFVDREKIMLVSDDEKIIWVENRRISDLCKITERTKNVMIISFQELVESK